MTEEIKKEDMLSEAYRYHLDVISNERIAGWAFKLDEENHSPVIEIRSGNDVLWTAEANAFREDLLQEGLGSGQYGFSLSPISAPVQSPISSIDLYIDGHMAQEAIPYIMNPRVDLDAYRFHLDHFSSDRINGWVFKEGEDNYRAKVEVRCGDVVIASGLAGDFRQDLLDANIGDGHYAFFLTPRLEAFPSAVCECNLFIDGEQATVESFVLSEDPEAIADAVYRAAFAAEIADFTQNVETTMAELKQSVVAANGAAGQEDFAVNGQLQVAMERIAELSARVKVIEQVLVKHFTAK